MAPDPSVTGSIQMIHRTGISVVIGGKVLRLLKGDRAFMSVRSLRRGIAVTEGSSPQEYVNNVTK